MRIVRAAPAAEPDPGACAGPPASASGQWTRRRAVLRVEQANHIGCERRSSSVSSSVMIRSAGSIAASIDFERVACQSRSHREEGGQASRTEAYRRASRSRCRRARASFPCRARLANATSGSTRRSGQRSEGRRAAIRHRPACGSSGDSSRAGSEGGAADLQALGGGSSVVRRG